MIEFYIAFYHPNSNGVCKIEFEIWTVLSTWEKSNINKGLSARLGGHPSYIRSFPLSPRDHDIRN